VNFVITATAITGLLLFSEPLTTAQNQSLSFEVASVKPSATNRYAPPVVDAQGFRITASLWDAILWAYDIHGYQLSAGPPWAHRDYYQIEARTQAPVTKKEMRVMLQSLLADRFKLKLHPVAKEMSVFGMVVGKSGLKLQDSKNSCGEDGCINVAPGAFIASSVTLDNVAATLSNMVDRPVLNQTGRTGRYDFRLKFDPSSMKRFDGQTVPNTSTDDPSIFVAFEDVGLKLEPRRAVVQTLVVDNAEKPAPN
jgi:bla regulator protein blaR1